MSGGGELEPQDSRKVVGTKGDPNKTWREEEDSTAKRGEYEPVDSRNVTGQASSTPDRWQNVDRRPPQADGQPADDIDPAIDPNERPPA